MQCVRGKGRAAGFQACEFWSFMIWLRCDVPCAMAGAHVRARLMSVSGAIVLCFVVRRAL